VSQATNDTYPFVLMNEMSILTRVAFIIKGPQFGSGFVAVNPNSKIPVGLTV
jgi:glutathione S-transferase